MGLMTCKIRAFGLDGNVRDLERVSTLLVDAFENIVVARMFG